jgi:hypothetical protein
MINVTVQLDEETNNVKITASPAIAGNRIAIYGLLQMGIELVHRLGDDQLPPKPPQILVPRLDVRS